MKVSIIIPAYNEAKTIEQVIKKVKKLKFNKEIIVVNDGSTDETYNKIKRIRGIKLLNHSKNLGKGAAVKTGIKRSSGEILIIQDADLELDPIQIPKVIAPIKKGQSEVVYGSRNLGKKDSGRSPLFYLGGLFITFLTNFLYGIKLTDEPCGYKAFSSKVIKSIDIKNNRFEWEPEVTAKLSKRNIKISEVSVDVTSRSIKEGKKLRRIDGLKAAWTLIKYRFTV